ncbi:hypothetical protein GCM10009789_03150 [Kribbella sancticallisti]|uniref:Baseplate assembly protein n=1 Tax=Kribbella sancticallisti TaxID=460087 RepID=A0ABP4MZH7_9ACTN
MTALVWDGGHLDGTPWQGIRHLSITIETSATPPVILVAHLNQPVGTLRPDQVRISGMRRPPPRYRVRVDPVTAPLEVRVEFDGWGDHAPYTFTLTDGGGAPLHPFYATATFWFTIDCSCGDCRPSSAQAALQPMQPPAVDLLTKDYTGFVALLTDWVSVNAPDVTDLSSAAFEQVLLELLAWAGDLTSYYQDRVAAEAFIETATQRFSLRQHAALLGQRLDDGRTASTVLAFDPAVSGFVPEGLSVRMPTGPDEVPVAFAVTARTPVAAEHASDRLVPAAFPGAPDAQLPAGARSLLVLGHDVHLTTGDRLALVQGSFWQVVTLDRPVEQFVEPGWVADPADDFDPLTDQPTRVTRISWTDPLTRALSPWQGPRLKLHANLVDARAGLPRIATSAPGVPPSGRVGLALDDPSTVAARSSTGALQLRSLRVPEWPVAYDDLPDGVGTAPAVQVSVSGQAWTQVEHLRASRSYDLHYTAQADEDGAVWLGFGDGVSGHEVALEAPDMPSALIEIAYRLGTAGTGDAGLDTLTRIVPPATGTDEEVTLQALGDVRVTNVTPGLGSRPPASLERIRQDVPAALHHGDLQRAVSLEDYAQVAMQVPGVGRATARGGGRLFNTVTVLIDPQGSQELDLRLRQAVEEHLNRLRMAGREQVVMAAQYVPLDVALEVCAAAGVPADVVRERVLAELRPGSDARPGWFHPDRLSFGDAVHLGDLLAYVQGIPGVRAVKATRFAPLGDVAGPAVRDVIALGRSAVARMDADPEVPENGSLEVLALGLDVDAEPFLVDAGPAQVVTP